MKYIIILVSIFAFGNRAHSQDDAITKFFAKYTNDDRFENVYISGSMLSMLGAKPEGQKEDKELLQVLSGLTGLRILTTESGPAKELFEEASSLMSGKGFENLMTIKDKEDAVTFLTKKGPTGINELLLMTWDGKEFMLMSITGKIDLQRISGLAKSLHINGMENLQQLEKKASPRK